MPLSTEILIIFRPNAKNMPCVTVKQPDKCTQPKSTPKCWAKSATRTSTRTAKASKRFYRLIILVTDRAKAFVLHVRHATFFIYWAIFPNCYLRDIADHGSHYLIRVPPPLQHHINIHQSSPFRMRQPQQQADFFRLYAKLLCYIVSGNSLVPYMDKSERNPYYKELTGLNVLPPRGARTSTVTEG